MLLELGDGSLFQGYGFGAETSVSGELVFQTGMIGYNESITDPSYRGQILVFTFPLIGNYGVPPRDSMDSLLHDMPAYFESSQIHVAGIVVASYSGNQFSHFLAQSSLGSWLKEQGIPAVYGVDTRALTKKIREKGSMLGKLLEIKKRDNEPLEYPRTQILQLPSTTDWRDMYRNVEWNDPNARNLVEEG